MADIDPRKLKGRRSLALDIASRATDPNFYAALEFLPNPDVILRKLGKQQEVYDDIMGDAHVIGELRSIRSALLGFEWRISPGSDDPASIRAFELIHEFMKQRPAEGLQWADVIWSMGCAVFKGYAVHEVIWARDGGLLMPVKVVDRPQRRFLFGHDNGLRLKTRENPMDGVELGNFKWLVTRHMASYDNPYGVAVFSNCFWPYTFKHSGFKFFAKFSERYGFPWPIGKYPPGTTQADQNALADRLAQMVEDAVAAVPNDSSVELLTVNTTGQQVHERLINLCNREMSKALTSQTLATEIQEIGARAASETHRDRETSVNQADRSIVEDTFNELFQWITEINIQGATAPRFEFYEEAEARKEMVETLKGARELVPLSKKEVYERLQMTPPEDEDDTIEVLTSGGSPRPPGEFHRHGCPVCGDHQFATSTDNDLVSPLIGQSDDLSDEAIEGLIDPIRDLLASSSDMQEFSKGLESLYPDMDDSEFGKLLQQGLLTSWLQGMDDIKNA